MNIVVERTRMKYRKSRERACYSVLDIEDFLKTLAWEGLIWCLQDMPDMSEAEEVLINFYMNKYRENQIYDNDISPALI